MPPDSPPSPKTIRRPTLPLPALIITRLRSPSSASTASDSSSSSNEDSFIVKPLNINKRRHDPRPDTPETFHSAQEHVPDHGEGEDKDGVKEEFMGGEDIEDFLHMPPPIVALPDQCSADEQAKSESPSPKSIPAKIKIKVQEVQRYTIPAKRTSTVSTTSHPSTSSTTDNTRLSLTNFPHFLPSDPLGWGTVYLNLARLTRRAAIDTITNGERYWEVGGQQVRGRGVSWPRWLEWKEVNEKGDRGWRRKVSLGQGKGDGGLPMVG